MEVAHIIWRRVHLLEAVTIPEEPGDPGSTIGDQIDLTSVQKVSN